MTQQDLEAVTPVKFHKYWPSPTRSREEVERELERIRKQIDDAMKVWYRMEQELRWMPK